MARRLYHSLLANILYINKRKILPRKFNKCVNILRKICRQLQIYNSVQKNHFDYFNTETESN